ncbi:Rtg3 protein [Saccharomycopsis crataegensis]|uniref:Rtg3 protein n=1 Tax=Saccharomycopsis crataegensis TaxID=43959 RepID=A0AAV5QWX8_9ASCO|nr:Rtg3 protein [Saccharomycopsis crataegensis]
MDDFINFESFEGSKITPQQSTSEDLLKLISNNMNVGFDLNDESLDAETLYKSMVAKYGNINDNTSENINENTNENINDNTNDNIDNNINIDHLLNNQYLNNTFQEIDSTPTNVASPVSIDANLHNNNSSYTNDPSLNMSIQRNSNVSDLLNNQYFSPNVQARPLTQPTTTGFSPSSYGGGESFDAYGSLNSPVSLSSSINNLSRPPASKQPLTKEDKLKRRREFHNAVERRRRDYIKERIKDLSKLVPPLMLVYDENGKETKPNKAMILTKAVDYIGSLNGVIDVQMQRRLDIIEKIKELQKL